MRLRVIRLGHKNNEMNQAQQKLNWWLARLSEVEMYDNRVEGADWFSAVRYCGRVSTARFVGF